MLAPRSFFHGGNPQSTQEEEAGLTLRQPLLRGVKPCVSGGLSRLASAYAWCLASKEAAYALYIKLQSASSCWLSTTTDTAFIRSEVNGRQSRHIVLLAFFWTDVVGAVLWASWCGAKDNFRRECGSFGMNHFVALLLGLPPEAAVLLVAAWNPWSFWSDCLLLPVWLLRLVVLDVIVWAVEPQTLLGDALWFFVLAVMCRVHSLALMILVSLQILSLYAVLAWGDDLYTEHQESFALVHSGHYGALMLIIVSAAYCLDEQSRLRCFRKLMSLEETNSALADGLLRWKTSVPQTGPAPSVEEKRSPTLAPIAAIVGRGCWHHKVLETPDAEPDIISMSRSSKSSVQEGGFYGFKAQQRALPADPPLPLPAVGLEDALSPGSQEGSISGSSSVDSPVVLRGKATRNFTLAKASSSRQKFGVKSSVPRAQRPEHRPPYGQRRDVQQEELRRLVDVME